MHVGEAQQNIYARHSLTFFPEPENANMQLVLSVQLRWLFISWGEA